MSKQDAKKFIEKLEKDPAFREKLKKTKDVSDRNKMVKAAHFNFTKNEVREVLTERYKQPMNEKQLRNIAGGSTSHDITVGRHSHPSHRHPKQTPQKQLQQKKGIARDIEAISLDLF